jgi:cysteine desulfurase
MDCYVSTKSACSSKKTDISSTLKAMNVDPKIGGSALRISFSHLTTKDEIDTFIIALTKSLNRVKKQR